jgi:3-phosphoshikimate 1-carboxyvinyltransferase
MKDKRQQLQLPAVARAQGEVTLPGSKSISNRTLLLAALAEGTTTVRNLLKSDDTDVMLAALAKLGVAVERIDENDVRVTGCGGTFPVVKASLFLGNAGTAFRPLTAALALCTPWHEDIEYHVHGVPRMHERPIGDLVDALRQLGADIEYLGQEGFPPLLIRASSLYVGDLKPKVGVRGDTSSQFLSSLLMAAPLIGQDVEVKVIGKLISEPYVAITLELMSRFRVAVQGLNDGRFLVPGILSHYRSPCEIHIEGDASSASYFLAAGAIAGIASKPVRVHGVGRASIQGDVKFADALAAMGAQITMGDNWIEASPPVSGKLTAIDADFNHIPDAAMTIGVLALFAEGVTTIRNIASWRVKETDRIAAMAAELRKVGATVEEGTDFIRIVPPSTLTPNASIRTYDDHRMAMCFSLVSLGGVPITIQDPDCVAKTFPDYFEVFARIVS